MSVTEAAVSLGDVFRNEGPESSTELHFRVTILLYAGAHPWLAQVSRSFRHAVRCEEMQQAIQANLRVLWSSGGGHRFSGAHCHRGMELSEDGSVASNGGQENAICRGSFQVTLPPRCML